MKNSAAVEGGRPSHETCTTTQVHQVVFLLLVSGRLGQDPVKGLLCDRTQRNGVTETLKDTAVASECLWQTY